MSCGLAFLLIPCLHSFLGPGALLRGAIFGRTQALWAMLSIPRGWKCWAVPEQVVSAVGLAHRGNELSLYPHPSGHPGRPPAPGASCLGAG